MFRYVQDEFLSCKVQTTKTQLIRSRNMGVEPKIMVPKIDGENNGKPYEQMDDLGGPPLFLETPICRTGTFACGPQTPPQSTDLILGGETCCGRTADKLTSHGVWQFAAVQGLESCHLSRVIPGTPNCGTFLW